jgi:kynurenine 3-monooxygenase
MRGRMIHPRRGETTLLPYSGREGEHINSVSRAGLNAVLLTAAEELPEVQIRFNERCVEVNLESGELRFASGRTEAADVIIAADGAGSAVRRAMERQVDNFKSESVFLDHGYKELHIPPSPEGGFLLEREALHIWPRHQFMMIALPNFDSSFTCTLFLAKGEDDAEKSSPSFSALTTAEAVREFFEREFQDAAELMPTLVEDFFNNPTGDLGTLRCQPWTAFGKVLLIGDAAHAMVPFYGQGMNCAFEDVRFLAALFDRYGHDWKTIFEEFARVRRPEAEAIQRLAEENFYEMRDATADPVFQRKRQLEAILEQRYPDYFSKYSLVTFREDVPYSLARKLGNAQDRLLMEICKPISDVHALNLEAVISRLRALKAADSARV